MKDCSTCSELGDGPCPRDANPPECKYYCREYDKFFQPCNAWKVTLWLLLIIVTGLLCIVRWA